MQHLDIINDQNRKSDGQPLTAEYWNDTLERIQDKVNEIIDDDSTVLADGSVTTAKLANSAVNASKINSSAIEARHFTQNCIYSSSIQDHAVSYDKLTTDVQNRIQAAQHTIVYVDNLPTASADTMGSIYSVANDGGEWITISSNATVEYTDVRTLLNFTTAQRTDDNVLSSVGAGNFVVNDTTSNQAYHWVVTVAPNEYGYTKTETRVDHPCYATKINDGGYYRTSGLYWVESGAPSSSYVWKRINQDDSGKSDLYLIVSSLWFKSGTTTTEEDPFDAEAEGGSAFDLYVNAVDSEHSIASTPQELYQFFSTHQYKQYNIYMMLYENSSEDTPHFIPVNVELLRPAYDQNNAFKLYGQSVLMVNGVAQNAKSTQPLVTMCVTLDDVRDTGNGKYFNKIHVSYDFKDNGRIKNWVNNNYYTQSYINNTYYNKSHINANYYTQSYINSNYYTKADINTNYATAIPYIIAYNDTIQSRIDEMFQALDHGRLVIVEKDQGFYFPAHRWSDHGNSFADFTNIGIGTDGKIYIETVVYDGENQQWISRGGVITAD